MNNKISFITELLNSKKIDASQKERLFLLTASELKNNVSNDNEDIIKRIAEIEKKIVSFEDFPNSKIKSSKSTVQEKKSIRRPILKKEHRPKDVADFMYLFNKRDGLKYLTHGFDETGKTFNIEEFLSASKAIFDTQTKKLRIPSELFSITNQFAFAKNPEWENITEGFSSLKWIDWSNKNQLSPFQNKEFEKIINIYRSLTRVESPGLDEIIKNIANEVFNIADFEIKYCRLDKADFYTFTRTFKKAITSIFEIINKKKFQDGTTNKIDITYQGKQGITNENYYEVSIIITHINSFPTKDFDQLRPEWKSEKGTIGQIRENLIGYCDYSIESKFENGCYRINLLKDKTIPDFEKVDAEKIEGTKHILKFYYKTSD